MAVLSQLVSEPKRTEGGTGMTNFEFFQKYKSEFLRRASMHLIFVVFLGFSVGVDGGVSLRS